MFVGSGVDENDGAQPRQTIDDRDERLGQRRRHDDRDGAAVTQDVSVLLRGEQRIERQRHVAGAQRAPERDRKVDAVVEQQRQPLFGPQPEVFQRRGKTACARLQLAISERTLRIDERDFFSETAGDRSIDEIGNGIVRLTLQQVVQHRLHPPSPPRHAAGAAHVRVCLFASSRFRARRYLLGHDRRSRRADKLITRVANERAAGFVPAIAGIIPAADDAGDRMNPRWEVSNAASGTARPENPPHSGAAAPAVDYPAVDNPAVALNPAPPPCDRGAR